MLQAVRLDAACVVVNLLSIPEQPEVADQCLQNILRLEPQCSTGIRFPDLSSNRSCLTHTRAIAKSKP